MARMVSELPSGTRITDYISLGVITKTFPVTAIDAVLKSTGRASIRQRDLPAHVPLGTLLHTLHNSSQSSRILLNSVHVRAGQVQYEKDAEGKAHRAWCRKLFQGKEFF